jgi:hypothetical protein
MGLKNVGVRHKEHDTTEFVYCTENKHGQNPIWVKCRNVTQKIDTTAFLFYPKHGQNPTHPTDKCFSLNNHTEKTKRTSSSA